MSTDNPSDIPSIFQAIQEHVNNIATYIGIILCCYNYFCCIIMFYVIVWISFVGIEILGIVYLVQTKSLCGGNSYIWIYCLIIIVSSFLIFIYTSCFISLVGEAKYIDKLILTLLLYYFSIVLYGLCLVSINGFICSDLKSSPLYTWFLFVLILSCLILIILLYIYISVSNNIKTYVKIEDKAKEIISETSMLLGDHSRREDGIASDSKDLIV